MGYEYAPKPPSDPWEEIKSFDKAIGNTRAKIESYKTEGFDISVLIEHLSGLFRGTIDNTKRRIEIRKSYGQDWSELVQELSSYQSQLEELSKIKKVA